MKKRKAHKPKPVWVYILIILILCYGSYKGITLLNKEPSVSISASSSLKLDTPFIAAWVTDVVDGDTIHAVIDNKNETIRLLLVDTPETKHPTKPIEPFGPEASQFTKDLLTGKQVKLVPDISKRDRYGRLLMYVWVGDQMVNELLLEKGLARVAVFPPDVKYVEAFRIVQKKAQQAELGIWSLENYVKDNGFEPDAVKAPPKSTPSKVEEIYANCSAVRAAGKAPIHKGDIGYSRLLDRDGNGVGCE
ncbi:MAG: thermonuclease family protein [Paenibacillaceae bacterium]